MRCSTSSFIFGTSFPGQIIEVERTKKKKDNFRQYKNSGKLWSKNMISLALRQFQDQILLTLNHNRFFIPETAISPQYQLLPCTFSHGRDWAFHRRITFRRELFPFISRRWSCHCSRLTSLDYKSGSKVFPFDSALEAKKLSRRFQSLVESMPRL